MCGIVGYTGREEAAPILLDGLARLEYRGYDSAGIAVQSRDAEGSMRTQVRKAKGRLKALCEMTGNGRDVRGCCGIGHTRWATHGEPSVANAHPHSSGDRRVTVVHNGIIENYREIREHLEKKGHVFTSDTDTEVVPHLLDDYYRGDPVEAIIRLISRVRGSYAFGIIFSDRPGELYAVRKDSPLIVGTAEDGNFIASDVPAILKYTRNVYLIDELEIAKLTADEVRFYNIDGEEIEKKATLIEWDAKAAEKDGYEHFMLKEIHEQSQAIRRTIEPRLADGRVVMDELGMSEEEVRAVSRIHMVACGSAYHVCMCAKTVFEETARIPVDVDLASEFRYRNPILLPNTLVIVVSQSGETADTLAALREAKARGHRVLAIVNVVGSSIAREADSVFYTWAGPEIAVATTKAYSAQLAAAYLLAIFFGKVRGTLNDAEARKMIKELQKLPAHVDRLLEEKKKVQLLAAKLAAANDMFFIGRGLDYAIAMEASLKCKEVSYIHSEAYAAGELKHGSISLIEEGMPVIGIATQEDLYEKTRSNLVECKSRGGFIIAVTPYGNYSLEGVADEIIYVPKTLPAYMASVAVVPMQLFAYYISLARGLDVDKPRNLAKSVTVE
ncbi:MAG: glutamine--fructose-6-phosphate transaminase (isomerizing) [Lachnospiraceae bacterium]|nr:glutamine--fructose-6-phosphate transaminase (isomerizing) [Lachnospiraceae bacterium]